MTLNEKTRIDTGFPGTEQQRRYARKMANVASESDIADYVRVASGSALVVT